DRHRNCSRPCGSRRSWRWIMPSPSTFSAETYTRRGDEVDSLVRPPEDSCDSWSRAPQMTPSVTRTMRSPRNQKAFTLVELVIVGALIAIFSGIAIFGVQAQFRNNQRKAIIGETRHVAIALDFAFNDVGFFPKLCFLDDTLLTLQLSGQQAFGGNGRQAFAFMHMYGLSTIGEV